MNTSCPAPSHSMTPGLYWRARLVGTMAVFLFCIGFSIQRLESQTLDLDPTSAHEGLATAISEVAALAALPHSSKAPSPEPELLAHNTDHFHLEAGICFPLESEPDKGAVADSRYKQPQPIGRLNVGSPAHQVRHPAWLAPSSRGPPTLA